MDKATFADTEAEPRWWLLQNDVDYSLVEPRKNLSEALGHARESQWFLEKWNVEPLYDKLDANDRSLLTEVDDATDETKRKEWLDKVVALLNRLKPGAANDPNGAEVSSAYSTGAPAQAGPASASAAPPPKKGPSPFAKKKADAPEAGEAGAAPPEAAEEVAVLIDGAVQTVMADVRPENVATLADEIGISQDKLQEVLQSLPRNFEQMVIDRARALAGSRS